MKTSLARLLLVPGVLFLAVATAQAEDLNAVKARIVERLPQVDAHKASGALGENNRGFVEVRNGGGNAVSVVAAENADREVVYAAIARQTGSSADTVGRARARQIAAGSSPGVWLQRDDGSWFRK